MDRLLLSDNEKAFAYIIRDRNYRTPCGAIPAAFLYLLPGDVRYCSPGIVRDVLLC
jgi:hypothetical protein